MSWPRISVAILALLLFATVYALPSIFISTPQVTITSPTPNLNITLDEQSNITFQWDDGANISGCRNCISFNTSYGELDDYNNSAAVWHFNEDFDTIVYDDSNNANNGTISGGVLWSAGRFGRSLYFNGGNYVSVPEAPSLNITEGITVAAWINPGSAVINARSSWYNGIVEKYKDTFVFSVKNKKLNWYIVTDWNNFYEVSGQTALSANAWYCVAAIYNGSAIKVYLNGVEDGSQPASGNIDIRHAWSTGPSYPLDIGKGNTWWKGYIDEVVIVNGSWSPTEISEFCNGSLSDGSHNVTVFAKNASGEINATTRFFTVDNTPPYEIVLNYPGNETVVSSQVTFNWTSSDALSNMTSELIIDGVVNVSGITTTNGTHTTQIATGLSDGLHNWSIKSYDAGGNANTSTTYYFTLDITAPLIDNVTYNPSSSDNLDPDVVVNVSAMVTDSTQVATVILQYSNGSGDWNRTLSNISISEYRGNFTPTSAGNWSFRIWANDSTGKINVTGPINLSIDYEWTWNRTPETFDVVGGIFGTNVTLFELVIENTGDFDMNFSLASDFSETYYNNTDPSSVTETNVTVTNHSSLAIGVNVTVPQENQSKIVTVNITALNSNATQASAIVNGTLVPYSAGPYLYVTIDAYDPSVTQGQSSITLSATVQNVGNDTANNAWLAWQLPSSWSITTGTLNVTGLTLIPKSSGFPGYLAGNIMTVSVGSSAAIGTQTIKALTGGTNVTTRSVSRSVAVSGTSSPPVVTGGGGSIPPSIVSPPSYSPTQTEKDNVFPSLKPLEMIRGTSHTFTVDVTNPFENSTLDDVDLVITGYPAERLTIAPSTLSGLGFGETKEFLVTVVVPASEGTVYDLDLALSGNVLYHDYPTQKSQSGLVLKRENVSVEFSESRTMTLIIQGEEAPIYSPTLKEVESLIQIPTTLELVRGSEVEFLVTVKNSYIDSFLEDLELKVKGYPEDVKVTPDKIAEIEYNEAKEFNVIVSAPNYLEKGDYVLNITLAGRVHYPSYPTAVSDITGEPLVVRDISLDMAESRILPLDLHVVSRGDAMAALQQTAESIMSLGEQDFATTRALRMLERAKNAFGRKDYEETRRLSDQILNIVGSASDAKVLLAEVGEDIRVAEEERWLKVVEAKNLYNLALLAYGREDYATATERLREAQITLSLETDGKVNKAKFVLDNLLGIVVGVLVLSFSLVQVYKRVKIARVSSKLRDLLAEEGGIIHLMRENQARYYKDEAMGRETYLKAMGEYRDRLTGISAERVGLIAERPLAIGAGAGIESLRNEDAGILKLLEDAQVDYFRNRTMSKSEYQSIARTLKTERAVVQGRMSLLEADMEKGRMM